MTVIVSSVTSNTISYDPLRSRVRLYFKVLFLIHLGLVCFVTILRATGIDMPVDGSSAPRPLVE
jgi:hypothetical protein